MQARDHQAKQKNLRPEFLNKFNSINTITRFAYNGQVGFHFLEDAGDDDGFDGTNVIDQALRVGAVRASPGKVGLLEPEPTSKYNRQIASRSFANTHIPLRFLTC